MNQELQIIFTEGFLNEFTGTQADLNQIIDDIYRDFPDADGKFVIGGVDEDPEMLLDMLDEDEEYPIIPKHKLN